MNPFRAHVGRELHIAADRYLKSSEYGYDLRKTRGDDRRAAAASWRATSIDVYQRYAA